MFSARKSAILLTGMLLLSSVEGAIAAGFSDVASTAWYSSALTSLASKGIIQGLPDGSVRPDAFLTRAEALKTVIRSREKFAPEIVWFTGNLPEIALFPDVDQNAWYAAYVEVGFLEGIMTGYPDGTFRPGETLTVEQALVILRRAYEREGDVDFTASDRLQNIPGQWYTDAASEAVARNLIAQGSNLRIGSRITRAQFFSLLERLHTVTQENVYSFAGAEAPLAMVTPVVTPASYNVEQASSARTQTQPVMSNPQVAIPLPLRITPKPFEASDPFVLRIDDEENAALASTASVYASSKSFAVTIPTLDIVDFTISHPADPFSEQGLLAPLGEGLGHLFAYPGSEGKTMIYGHSSNWPWDKSEFARAFRQVNKMNVGDRVYVTYNGRLHVYEVTGNQIVSAKDMSPFDDAGQEELILYTCWPPDSTQNRFLVHALPVETIALR